MQYDILNYRMFKSNNVFTKVNDANQAVRV